MHRVTVITLLDSVKNIINPSMAYFNLVCCFLIMQKIPMLFCLDKTITYTQPHVYIHPHVYLSVCIPICVYVHLCVYLSVCISIHLYICPCIYLFVYISIHVYICLCVYLVHPASLPCQSIVNLHSDGCVYNCLLVHVSLGSHKPAVTYMYRPGVK